MSTRKVRNILFVLFMMVSFMLVPTVSAEVMVESSRDYQDVTIDPNGRDYQDVTIDPNGRDYQDVTIDPNG